MLNLERFYVSELPYMSSVDLQPMPPPVPFGSGSTTCSSSSGRGQLNKHLPHSMARYVSRRRLVPHIKPVNFGKEELALMISGHFYQQPQNPGKKEKAGVNKKAKGSFAKHPKPQANLLHDAKSKKEQTEDYSDLADIDIQE